MRRVNLAAHFLSLLDRLNRATIIAIVILSISILGMADYLTGFELAFAFFYVVPVSLSSWSIGRRAGFLTSIVSALVWQGSNLLAGEQFSSPFIVVWNLFTRLGFFLIISALLAELRGILQRERELSHTDSLTGILNRRAFYEVANLELERMRRYGGSLTIVYIDIDNFKSVNDILGHGAGDLLLEHVARILRLCVRDTDTIARLGGDEFTLLLSGTGPIGAQSIVPRLRRALLARMQEKEWPVTFSIGTLTCTDAPDTTDAIIQLADDLMYKIKKNGKDAILHATYPE